MELKPGYKQTEVGVIPEDWDVVTVSDACDLVVDCKNRTPPFVSHSEYAVARTSNVRNGRFIYVDLRFTDYESFRRWTARAIPKAGDIMLTREAPLGEVCAVPETSSVCLGQRMMLLRPSDYVAQSSYLLFALMSEVVKGNLLKKIGGSTVGHAKVDDIRLLPVPLPQLEEQKHISAVLLDVDNLVRDLESLIAKKQDVKQAAMQELLTGKRRLPGFVGEWEVKKLSELGEFIKGSGVKRDQATSGDLPCVRYGEIYTHHENYISEFMSYISTSVASRATAILQGDILFAGSGETKEEIGKSVALARPVKAYAGGDIVILRQQAVDALFLGYRLNAIDISRQKAGLGQGDAVVHISAHALSKISVSLPERAEQEAIASILYEMDTELRRLQLRLAKTQALKQGMMQQLLTGKIRLK